MHVIMWWLLVRRIQFPSMSQLSDHNNYWKVYKIPLPTGLVLQYCSMNSQLWPAVKSFWVALLPLLPSPHCSTYPWIVDPLNHCIAYATACIMSFTWMKYLSKLHILTMLSYIPPHTVNFYMPLHAGQPSAHMHCSVQPRTWKDTLHIALAVPPSNRAWFPTDGIVYSESQKQVTGNPLWERRKSKVSL